MHQRVNMGFRHNFCIGNGEDVQTKSSDVLDLFEYRHTPQWVW
jgi:hypothetical protein